MKEFELPYESFIGGWFIDESICDGLIDYYHNTKENDKCAGLIGPEGWVNPESKDSIELGLQNTTSNESFKLYLKALMSVGDEYFKKYSYSRPRKVGFREGHNIQWYPKGGGYKIFHCERKFADPVNLCRHLTYMTYLNEVPGEGGETEFLYQKLKIKPKKGLTLIWPVDWTHTHRGIPALEDEKMIITGWIHFTN